MDFTTVARVKALSGNITDAKQDALIQSIISGRSADAENLLDRYAMRATYTEVKSVLKGQHVFRIKGYPIQSITSVINDSISVDLSAVTFDSLGMVRIGPAFGVGIALAGSINPLAGTILAGGLIFGPGTLQITYVGGMAVDTADFISKYPDIAYNMDLQILFDMKRKDNLIDKSISVGGGQSNYNDMDWIPSMLKVLRRRKRTLPLG